MQPSGIQITCNTERSVLQRDESHKRVVLDLCQLALFLFWALCMCLIQEDSGVRLDEVLRTVPSLSFSQTNSRVVRVPARLRHKSLVSVIE